jgi:sporulation protein YlmC with PRC-barrel domain
VAEMISEISTLFGMRVYTDEGRYVGKIQDVVIDEEKKMIKGIAVVEYNRALIESRAQGVILPYALVKAIGDIVLVKDVFKRRRKKQEAEEADEVEAS